MRRQIPLIICFICGIAMIIQFFIPHSYSQILFRRALDWTLVIGIFALVLGIGSLIHVHWIRISRMGENWQYSLLVFLGLIGMTLVGLINGKDGRAFLWLFDNIQVPLDATMFSLLAFFIASAAFRAFRARTLEATLLLTAAIIVMFGNAPVGKWLWNQMGVIPLISKLVDAFPALPENAKDWILENPNMASRRAIYLGIGLGGISQALRIILGIERSHLGGGD
ncbi:hypothetical protein H8E77_39445 [bacterium]|nr:hypothetical protein [bacterium]